MVMTMRAVTELNGNNVDKIQFATVKRHAIEVLGEMTDAIMTNNYVKMLSLISSYEERCFINFGDGADYPVDIGEVIDILKNHIIKANQEENKR